MAGCSQFYDTFPHTYTVDYLIEHAYDFDDKEVTVEDYVSTCYADKIFPYFFPYHDEMRNILLIYMFYLRLNET